MGPSAVQDTDLRSMQTVRRPATRTLRVNWPFLGLVALSIVFWTAVILGLRWLL